MNPDILEAAIEERYLLEARLRSNPDFRRLEAVRRLIEAYQSDTDTPVRRDAAGIPTNPPAHVVGSNPAPNLDPPPISTPPASLGRSSFPAPGEKSATSSRDRRNGKTSALIRKGAEEYLRKKGSPAKGAEIARVLEADGLVINGKSSAVVANRLTACRLFVPTEEGYALAEWSSSPKSGSTAPSKAAVQGLEN